MVSNQRRPLPIELATLAYTLLTTLLILFLWKKMDDPLRLLEGRALVLVGMGLLRLIYQARPGRHTMILRYIFPLSLLAYWYPDTYEFCQLLPYQDNVFAAAEQALFGCQPSLAFSEAVGQKLWSELFHMGYFSYYPLIALTVLAPLFTRHGGFERTSFIVLTCFFFYYFIYLFLPVAGPQYYFHAIGNEMALSGHFPQMGDYFRYHTELAPSQCAEGFFRNLVEATQASGERPTAAFPSSHVGISTILLILLWQDRRWLFAIAVPFYVLLCCATVYIQAHYLIDVFGGLVTAVIFYSIAQWLWERQTGS